MADPSTIPGGVELVIVVILVIFLFGSNILSKIFHGDTGFFSDSASSGQTYTRAHLVQASPDKFERLVAKAWEQQGYSIALTEKGPDQGIDVIPSNDEETVIIQAKRHQTGNRVGAPTVRRVAGAREEFGADRAVIATSASFSDPAEESASSLGVKLVDGVTLARILSD